MGECERGEQGRVGSPAHGPPEGGGGVLRTSPLAEPSVCSHGWRTNHRGRR